MRRGGGRRPPRAIGSATRTLTPDAGPGVRAGGDADADRARAPRPGRRADGGARRRSGRPCSSATISSDADRAEDLLDRDRAEVAEPEDLAGQLALAAGEDDAAALDLAVERLPVEAVGDAARR